MVSYKLQVSNNEPSGKEISKDVQTPQRDAADNHEPAKRVPSLGAREKEKDDVAAKDNGAAKAETRDSAERGGLVRDASLKDSVNGSKESRDVKDGKDGARVESVSLRLDSLTVGWVSLPEHSTIETDV